MNIKTKMVIHNNEETVVKFIKDEGQFIFLGRDEQTYRLFKNALITALNNPKISLTFLKNAESSQIIDLIEAYCRTARNVLVVMDLKQANEHVMIRDIRLRFDKSKAPVIVLTKEIGENVINLLQETGANSIVVVPYSPVNLIEKIANIIKPSGLSEIIEAAKKLLAEKQYESVLRICEGILKRKPDSTAAYMLKGDVHLARAEEMTNEEMKKEKKNALHCYTLAWRGNSKYVEPLKRLLNYYKVEQDVIEQLHFLIELDVLSPLSVDRKIDIGAILIRDAGQKEEAVKYFDGAVTLLKKEHEGTEEQLKNVYSRINDILKDIDPELAKKHPF